MVGWYHDLLTPPFETDEAREKDLATKETSWRES